jgi:DNA topoisomerase IA
MIFDSHILNAARQLVALDDKQVNAVDARIELDLRIGFAFTRFLTLKLRPLGGPMSELMLSYGKPYSPVHGYEMLTSQDRVNFQRSASSWTGISVSKTLCPKLFGA